MSREKEMLQKHMLKYAKSIILLSDDIVPDNAFQMLSVIKSSIKEFENSLYREKDKTYNGEGGKN